MVSVHLQVLLEACAARLSAGVPHEARVAIAEVPCSPLVTLLQQHCDTFSNDECKAGMHKSQRREGSKKAGSVFHS